MQASVRGYEGCIRILLEAKATVNDTTVSLERVLTQAHATWASKPWASHHQPLLLLTRTTGGQLFIARQPTAAS